MPNTNIYPQPKAAISALTRNVALVVIAAMVIAASAGVGALFVARVAAGVGAFFGQTDAPVPVAARYYLALMEHDYPTAAASLAPNATVAGHPVDPRRFAEQAAAADVRDGRITGYSIEGQDDDATRLTITVRRGGHGYDVHLNLARFGDLWKIVSADGI
jgi:hypothetical protein